MPGIGRVAEDLPQLRSPIWHDIAADPHAEDRCIYVFVARQLLGQFIIKDDRDVEVAPRPSATLSPTAEEVNLPRLQPLDQPGHHRRERLLLRRKETPISWWTVAAHKAHVANASDLGKGSSAVGDV